MTVAAVGVDRQDAMSVGAVLLVLPDIVRRVRRY